MQEHVPTSGHQSSVKPLNVRLLSRLERTAILDGVIRAVDPVACVDRPRG